MRQEEGEMEAFSKVRADINYPYSALASENRSSMPSRRVEKAPRMPVNKSDSGFLGNF